MYYELLNIQAVCYALSVSSEEKGSLASLGLTSTFRAGAATLMKNSSPGDS